MDKRELARQKSQANIEQWEARMQAIRAKLKGKSAEARLEAERELNALEDKVEAARRHLAELKVAAEDTWEEVTGKIEALSKEASQRLDRLVSRKK